MIALGVSALVAVAVAYLMLEPTFRSGPPEGSTQLAEREPAAERQSVQPMREQAPTGTPTPTVTPEPTPSPEPLPEKTPIPTASPSPSPSATPTPPPSPSPSPSPSPTPGNVSYSGQIRTHLGDPVPNGQLYLVATGENTNHETVRKAFRNQESYELIDADEEGRFEFTTPPNKRYLLGLMINDSPSSYMQEIGRENPEEVTLPDFSFPEPYELRGVAADEFAQLIPGIPVEVEYLPASLIQGGRDPIRIQVETNSEGRYQVILTEPERITVWVPAERLPEPYLYERPAIDLTRSDFGAGKATRIDFELMTGASLDGAVSTASGEPITGAVISVMMINRPEGAGAPRPYETETGSQGFFTLEMLPPGDYAATVTHPDFMSTTIPEIDVRGFAQVDVTLSPLPSLKGKFVLADYSGGIPKVQLHLIDRYNVRTETIPVPGGGEAEFEISGVDTGRYILAALAEKEGERWYGEQSVYISGNSEIAPAGLITMLPVVEQKGRLNGSQKDLAEGVMIRAELNNRPDAYDPGINGGSKRLFPIVSASLSGSFTIENLIKSYDYRITASDRATGNQLGSALVTAGQEEPVIIPVAGTGNLTGVLRSDDGSACAGREIRLQTGLASLEGGGSVIQEWTTETTFDGGFSFFDVPAGQARLFVSGEEILTRVITVPREQTLNLALQCAIYVPVTFSVRPEEGEPFGEDEQFIVVAKPGYPVKTNFRELSYGELETTLEPAKYTITRTATMASAEFEVFPRLDSVIQIDFGKTEY